MKTQIPSTAKLVLVAMVFFIAGSLGYGTRTAADETTAQEAKEKTMQALEAIGNYTAEQRDEAIQKAKETLADMDTRIERLETQYSQKWDHMDQAARRSAQQTLTTLRKQRTEAAEWYGGLKHSSRKAWEDVKSGFLESYHQLQGAFDKAAKEF
jgi:uncharacterized protein (DUF3084 family)